jgi:hypothetical protein
MLIFFNTQSVSARVEFTSLQQFDKRLPVTGITRAGKPAGTVLSGNSFETAGNCRLKDYRRFAL